MIFMRSIFYKLFTYTVVYYNYLFIKIFIFHYIFKFITYCDNAIYFIHYFKQSFSTFFISIYSILKILSMYSNYMWNFKFFINNHCSISIWQSNIRMNNIKFKILIYKFCYFRSEEHTSELQSRQYL